MASALNLDKLLDYARSRPLALRPRSFYFLRHGQTPRNALKIFQTYAEPLSERGIQQAADAAAALAAAPVAPRTLCVSDATRTLQTAAPVAAALGLAPHATPALRERNFGELWGTSSAVIDWDCAPAGGETLQQFVDRTRAAFDDALNGDSAEPVLIVAHGGNLLVLTGLLGLEFDVKLLGNALPIYFTREGETWTAEPLLAPAANGVNLA